MYTIDFKIMKVYKNLSFGKKLWIFATSMILILLVFSTFGYFNSQKVKKSSEDYAALVDANENFLLRKIDHLNWADKISQAINTNAPKIEVQTDPTKCNLGRFLNSDENQHLCDHHPQYANYIDHLHEAHDHLHGTAVEVIDEWRQIHPGLEKMLLQRLDDHRRSMASLADSLLSDSPITIETDPVQHEFVRWIESEEAMKLAGDWPEFAKMKRSLIEPYNRLHASVTKIQQIQDREQKISIYQAEIKPTANEIAGYFLELVDMESQNVLQQGTAKTVFENQTLAALNTTQEHLESISGYLTDKQMSLQDGMSSTLRQSMVFNIIITLLGVILAIAISIILIRLVTGPIHKCVQFTEMLGQKDFTGSVNIDQEDEMGVLSRTLNITVGAIRTGFTKIKEGVNSLASSTTELSAISVQLNQNAKSTNDISESVVSAAEICSDNVNTVAASVEQVNQNLRTIASSSEEMSATIQEIAKNTDRCRNITGNAVSRVKHTSEQMDILGNAAKHIDSITETIRGISDQTNLLALNATIEAASAGDAGKGFAVVANEIKELSRQTALATEQITKSIEGIQTTTGHSISDISEVVEVIEEVDQITMLIASAVEEQSNTTTEISSNVAQTADGVQEVSQSFNNIDQETARIAQDIVQVNQAAVELVAASSQLSSSAGDISHFAEELNTITGSYKV